MSATVYVLAGTGATVQVFPSRVHPTTSNPTASRRRVQQQQRLVLDEDEAILALLAF